MSRPGDRLRPLAARVFSPITMERLIAPLIADMQLEYDTARLRGSGWNLVWTRAVGYTAFGKAVMVFAKYRLGSAIEAWAVSDDHAMGRVVGFMIGTVVGVFTLMNLTALTRPSRMLPAIFLQTLPFAIAVGLPFGILCGLRGRTITNRVRRATLLWA